MSSTRSRARSVVALTVALGFLTSIAAQASSTCSDEQSTPQVPKDLKLCEQLKEVVRAPHKLPLNQYEAKLSEYLTAMCHRDEAGGWKVDKRVRDTGPWIGKYENGKWTGQGFGTHAPVLVWYSPEMYAWLKQNRPEDGPAPALIAPVPDGAMMIKEMYPYPAAACTNIDPVYLLANQQGAAVMVRDGKGAHDGWFWGWYGWTESAGRPTGRRSPRAPIPTWALASTAPTATPRRATTRPSRR